MIQEAELLKFFNQLSSECLLSGRAVVPLTDIDYYTLQITIEYGCTVNEGIKLAKQMALVVNKK